MSKNAWNRYTANGSWRYEILVPGFKCNMTDIQAALGVHQLRKLFRYQERRRTIVDRYQHAFKNIAGLTLPVEQTGVEHAWHLYVLRVSQETVGRDRFIEELKARGVGTSVHFIPLHVQPWYRDTFGFSPEDFPVASHVFGEIVSLPLYPKMTDEDVEAVIAAVMDVMASA